MEISPEIIKLIGISIFVTGIFGTVFYYGVEFMGKVSLENG